MTCLALDAKTIRPLDKVGGGKHMTLFYSFYPVAPKNSS